MPAKQLPYQLVGVLASTGNFVLFHYHYMLLSLTRSDYRLLRRGLCLHYQIPVPVLYGVLIILEEVKMGFLKLEFFAGMMGTQPIPTVLYIPTVLMCVVLLKWKFKLSTSELCSMRYVSWNCKSKLFSTILWSRKRSDGTIWLVVKLPGAPGYISGCRVFLDSGKIHEIISGNSHYWNFWGADDSLLQLPLSLANATRVLNSELLKVNAGVLRQDAKGRLYLLEIWLLHFLWPSSEVYEGHSVHERIILVYSDPTWNCLHLFHCAQHPSSCLFSFDFIHYYRSTRPPVRIVGILVVIITTHFTIELKFIDYSRWKYRWVPTSLWSVRIVGWVGNIFISVVYLGLNWNDKRNFLCEVVAYNQVAAILHMMMWLDYLKWKFKFFSTVLWSVEGASEIYDVQGIKQLVEHERMSTKLQQNFKWQVHVVPFQSCTLTKAKGGDLKVIHADLMKNSKKIIGYATTVVTNMVVQFSLGNIDYKQRQFTLVKEKEMVVLPGSEEKLPI
ncbi:uncharacterized protein LOC113310440 [Papaver somniferum]|uniref:uncharacterized protein LOC113310440 n=1 Tax=Papaver somniferum TaxID=3469 RepID=UPI000E6FD9EA|nr:uncharacterized protein LOC113310440 [Papaver somniferum]